MQFTSATFVPSLVIPNAGRSCGAWVGVARDVIVTVTGRAGIRCG